MEYNINSTNKECKLITLDVVDALNMFKPMKVRL